MHDDLGIHGTFYYLSDLHCPKEENPKKTDNYRKPQDINALNLQTILPKNHKGLIIIHHGFQGNQKSMMQYIIPFCMKHYIVFAFDARGHGRSIKSQLKRESGLWYRKDNVGIFPDFNVILSQRWAEAIQDYFINHELNNVNYTAIGWGESKIKFDSKNPLMTKGRRIEILIRTLQ